MSPSHYSIRSTVVLAAALLTAACAGRNATVTSAGGEAAAAWSGQLLPRSQPPLSGRVIITPADNASQMVVMITVGGAPSMADALAWRLYQGTCGAGGVMVGTPGEYPPVIMRADGSGQSTATVNEAVPTRGVYSVRVYANTSPGAPQVACGDLTQGDR